MSGNAQTTQRGQIQQESHSDAEDTNETPSTAAATVHSDSGKQTTEKSSKIENPVNSQQSSLNMGALNNAASNNGATHSDLTADAQKAYQKQQPVQGPWEPIQITTGGNAARVTNIQKVLSSPALPK